MKVLHCFALCHFLFVAAIAGPAARPNVTVPVFFEPNVGQTDASVKYLGRGRNATLWLTEAGPVLGVQAKPATGYVKLRFEGARRAPAMEPELPQDGVSNYFLGSDPAKWHANVPHFARVRYREVWPGIDVVFYGNPDQIEYDFVVRPGADPSRIRLSFDGARSVTRESSGDLVLKLSSGEVRAHAPVIRQGGKIVGGHYILRGKRGAGFAVDSYDRSAELIIDPILTYASFLGGEIGDQAYGVAVDKQGNIYVAGETSSLNFPTKNALYSSLTSDVNNPCHAFLTKINPAASGAPSLVFSTLFGSNGIDQAYAVAVDASNNPVVAGYTASFTPTFPQMNAFVTAPTKSNTCGTTQNSSYCGSAFVTKFTSSGSALMYSSYLSGSGNDSASGIAIDGSGNVWIAGTTGSLDFPVRGQAFQSNLRGSQGGFLSEVSSAASLVYSTYFSAQPATSFSAVAVDASGNAYAAGTTTASIPTTPNAYQTQYPGAQAAIVVELSPTAGLLYSSYLGGSNGPSNATAIAVDSSGNIYVAGGTSAASFPVTSSAFKSTPVDDLGLFSADGFLSKLNPALQGKSQLVYSTLYGGSFDDAITAVAIDSAGRVTMVGTTDSVDLPTTLNSFECCWTGYVTKNFITNYGFLARVDTTQSGNASLTYSSYLGGTLYSTLTAVALDSTGNIASLAGWVESTDTPITSSAFQTTFGGQSTSSQYDTDYGDAYLARFDFSQSGPASPFYLNGAGLDALPSPSIAPGLIFTLKGTGLGPSTASLAQIDASTGLIANNLENVQVFVNGIACALTYVSATQINAIAPYELATQTGTFANVQAFYNNLPGTLLKIPVTATAPGILSLDDGSGQGVIINQDRSLNGPNNPAAIGSVITIYATGEGQTNPPGIDGGIANNPNALPHPVAPLSVSIGTVAAPNIAYAGTAPEEIYGLLQVNVTVPNGISPGSAVPVVLTIGGVSSQTGLTMAVKAQ